MNVYLLMKLLHIIAVIMFMGNITIGLFWMRQAHRTDDPKLIAFTMRGIINSDKWFTIPGVIIITAFGFAAALHASIPILRTGWIFWPIVFFTLSGIIFSVKLAPLQKQIHSIAARATQGTFDKVMYQQKLRQWESWGLWASLLPFAALVMMVLKIPVTSPLA